MQHVNRKWWANRGNYTLFNLFFLKIDLTICWALGMNLHVQHFVDKYHQPGNVLCSFSNPTVNWWLNEWLDLCLNPCVSTVPACMHAGVRCEWGKEWEVRKRMMPRYRRGWDEEKWRERATFHLAPIQPAYQLSVELFQRQFIFRYFKNSFEGDFHSMAAALAFSLLPLR